MNRSVGAGGMSVNDASRHQDYVMGDEFRRMSVDTTKGNTSDLTLPSKSYAWEDEDGRKLFTVEVILPSGTLIMDVEAKVKMRGTVLHIRYKYPSMFFHDNFLPNVSVQKNKLRDSITRAMEKEVRRMRTENDNDTIRGVMKVKLPFKCEINAVPVKTDAINRCEFFYHQHQDKEYNENKKTYYVLIINLRSVDKPFVEPKMVFKFVTI